MPLMRALAALLLLAGCGMTQRAGPEPFGTYTWPAPEHGLGGFSALELSDDGRAFTTISDRGHLLTGTITRDADGRITGIDTAAKGPLRDAGGAPLPEKVSDAEGLARARDGTLFLSFEGDHRVTRLFPDGRTEPLPGNQVFATLVSNAGLETLAIDAQGRLLAIPERSGQLTQAFPLWRFDGQTWRIIARIPRRGGFLPVGADVGPDGHLYLLERAFTGFGFRSRLRRFSLRGDDLTEETLLETRLLRHDNLEGLSVWRDATGAIRLTMISDDNFNAVQSTQLVEYRLPR